MTYKLPTPNKIDPNPSGVIRESDGAFIPADPLNADYADYQKWTKAGNKPKAADAAPAADNEPTIDDRVAALEAAVETMKRGAK